MISYETKRKCVEQARHGKKYSEIYSENIKPVSTMSFRSFARRIAEWKQKVADDDHTLEAANLSYKFAPYASTVQVNGNGEVVQAWIKQHTEYATAQIREVHIGHLHRESESRDEYGVQIRRLCTKNKDDEWTDAEGFMSQKRFMLFEWAPGKLKSIHYV